MSVKTHNGVRGVSAKVDLRERVLAAVTPAKVLDCYCGPVGEMHRAVWHRAQAYAGIDKEWLRDDERRRFIGDTPTVLRSIELNDFNVFDVDAFGSPFNAMAILAARRKWSQHERGAIIITDGTDLKVAFGGKFRGMKANLPSGSSFRGRAADDAIREWLRDSNVTPVSFWKAEGVSSERGSMRMRYSAIVFVGNG